MLTFGLASSTGAGCFGASGLGIGANGSTSPFPCCLLLCSRVKLAIAGLVLPFVWKCHSSRCLFTAWFCWFGLIVMAGGYWLLERTVL